MKKTKLEKGITLIALIITIVVLLILAVVSIGSIKESKIVEHVQNSAEQWKQSQKNEVNYLERLEDIVLESSVVKVKEYIEGVPIPVGFEHKEGTKEMGLVIKNTIEGSEFVWIPVTTPIVSYGLNTSNKREPDVVTGVEPTDSVDSASGTKYDAEIENLKLAGLTEDLNGDGLINAYDFKQQLTDEFNAMSKSIEKYGGFYVGRYEVSIGSDGKAQSIAGKIPAVAHDSTSYSWYGLYKLCKTYKTNSVTSSMIWGSQYDAIMTFIGDKAKQRGNVAHDSTNFITTPYQTGGTDYSTNYKIKEGEEGYIAYNDICKNIYDLAGNVYEFILEANSNNRSS